MTIKAPSAIALTAALVVWGVTIASPQVPTSDAELAAGIKQVNGGDFDKAVVTLEGVARRLAADPTRVKDLGWAHVYRGVALAGLEQDGKAKLAFRDALVPMMVAAQRETGARGQVKDISLGEFGFSPKVIQLFEAAKKEALADAAWRRSLEARLEKEPGRKRSKTVPILLGVGAAGALGAGLALRGGEEVELGQASFRIVSADPPLGGTIRLGSAPNPGVVALRVTYSGRAPASGQLIIAGAVLTTTGQDCLHSQNPRVTMRAGEISQFEVPYQHDSSCPAAPFSLTTVQFRIVDVPPNNILVELIPAMWNVVAAP